MCRKIQVQTTTCQYRLLANFRSTRKQIVTRKPVFVNLYFDIVSHGWLSADASERTHTHETQRNSKGLVSRQNHSSQRIRRAHQSKQEIPVEGQELTNDRPGKSHHVFLRATPLRMRRLQMGQLPTALQQSEQIVKDLDRERMELVNDRKARARYVPTVHAPATAPENSADSSQKIDVITHAADAVNVVTGARRVIKHSISFSSGLTILLWCGNLLSLADNHLWKSML